MPYEEEDTCSRIAWPAHGPANLHTCKLDTVQRICTRSAHVLSSQVTNVSDQCHVRKRIHARHTFCIRVVI
jgi:hypothetical protein